MTAETKLKLRVSGIDHVVLHVKDLERSKRFYLDLLGFEIAHESSRRSFLRCGSQQVALFERAGMEINAGDEMNRMALRLEAGEYEEVRAALESEGVTISGRPGDDRCIYFSDPDRHHLQVLTLAEQR
jgi:catechol 2,3-dioxygenase-like lactoylglutathione lyase family enzyme